MKQLTLIPIIALLFIYCSDCSCQISRNEMISYYKKIFLYRCMQLYEIDTGFRDEVCTYNIDWIDKRSLLEVDSLCKRVGEEIRLDVQIINEDSSGEFYPSRLCVLHYCLNQYESEDMDRLAKGLVRRLKRVKPFKSYKY